MATEVTEDLWTDILKRLPIKSIGRFRSVCKAWNSFLSSTLFIAIHHNFTIAAAADDQRSKSYLLVNKHDLLLQGTLYHPAEQQQKHGGRVTYLDLPYSSDPFSNYFDCLCFEVVDVVHGVICLSSGLDFILWNPAIGKCIPGRFCCDDYIHRMVAFGFDAANNDFKVVRLSAGSWYDVLSVRESCWRREALPDNICSLHYYRRKSNSRFANGNIYWITHNKDYDAWALLLFDCKSEEFKTIDLPQELTAQKDHELVPYQLFKHGDNLAVVTSCSWRSSFEVWVMEDGKSHSHSWKKLSKHSGRHLGAMGNGEKMFKPCHRNELSSDDLPIRLGSLQQPLGSLVYRDSLFLMDMDVNTQNLSITDLTPVSCDHCYHRIVYYSGNPSTIQSKLL